MENLGHHEVGASAGFEVIQEALQEAVAEEGPGPVRAVDWDQSLVELSHASRCPIPGAVQSRWCQARERADCGLLPEVHHAWVSVDAVLYLWDYCRPGGTLLTLPADSTICSVAISVPRAGIFQATLGVRPRFVLVVATRLTVSLTGITATGLQAPLPLQPSSPSREVDAGETSLRDWTSGEAGRATAAPQTHGSSLQLVPLQGFSAPCDSAVFHRIRATPEGRIFLLSGAPHLHELRCLPRDGWFQCKCRLVRHFVGLGTWWQWPAQRHLPSPGRLRLLECSSQGHVLLADDRGTLRLCFASESLGEQSFGEPAGTLQELAVLTAPQLANQARSLTQSHMGSLSLTHLFPGLGLSGQLQLDASTAAGERLHFALSRVAADASGKASQAYGFWLQHVSGSLASTVGQGAAPEPRGGSGRAACLEEHFDACSFTPGCSRSGSSSALGPVWLQAALRPLGAGASDLAVSARVDQSPQGRASTLELQGLLSFDSPVLDVAPESLTQQGQRFVVFLADRLEEITLTPRSASSIRRAPANTTECCAYLMALAKMAGSSTGTGSLTKPHYDWLFTLDDARYPGYEEQQRALQLQQTVPGMIKGRWLSGFLQFLAATLRPVWNRHFLVAGARSVPVHNGLTSLLGGLCNKRQRCLGPAALAFSEQQATSILAQLAPVIAFVKDGLSTAHSHVAQVSAPGLSAPSSATARARLFAEQPRRGSEAEAQQRTDALPASDRAMTLLAQSFDVLDRVQQLLELATLLPQSRGLQAVLDMSQEVSLTQAPPWAALLRTPFRDMARSPECLAPAAELCSSIILHEGPEVSDGFCRLLQARCPAIFSLVDLSGSARGRYVPSTGAIGSHWDTLVQTVSSLAAEDPKTAAELCVERLLRLPAEGHSSSEQARALLEAFLDGLGTEQLRDGKSAVENLLAQTASWRVEGEPGENIAPQPLVHSIVVDHMLSHAPRFKQALEALQETKTADLETLLRRHSAANLAASEQLCRYYQLRGMKTQAKEQLLQLAERPDKELGLRDRIRHLEMAQEQDAQAKDSDVCIRLDVARKLQLPLFLELESLASDPGIDVKFREEAAGRCERLQGLRDLKELYEAALQLGLFHQVLSISAFAGATLDPAVITSLWLGLFFPPSGCAYSPPKSTTSLHAGINAADLFPLLLRRQQAGFLGGPAAMPRKLACREPKDQLREKVLGLLAELQEVAKPSGSLWDVRSVCTVLEYSNCLWLRAIEQTARPASLGPRGGDSAAGSPLCEESRLWVALEVLTAPPFEFTLADLVAFYAELIAHLDSWAKDLQAALPLEFREKSSLAWALPSEEDLHLHLAQVSVVVTGRWLRQVESLRIGPGYSATSTAAEFASVWLRHADGLLAGLSLRLNSLQLSRGPARALLSEVLCLERAGRRLCEGVVQAPLSGRK